MLSVGGRLHGGAPPWRRPRHRSCLASPPACSNSSGGDPEKARPVLSERYRDGAAKRYLLDGDSKLQVHWEKHDSSMNTAEDENVKSSIPQAIRDFVLPAGFPESVSDDYLQYMLLQFPTNVTGWICYTLVTSSLLKAVGVGSFTGTSAAASAAAIRWVSKDGIGAFGRILIGGRFGTLFDDDPKKWRMYADFIGSAGSIFDLTTPLYPGYFLPLASLGNLAKAVGRGFRDPSNRVIQNHFSKSGNLGEIAAKEEVWEVGAQLLGLSIGVLILDTPGIQSSYSTLTLTWLGVRLLHLWFRYQSLIVLKFRTVNLKRARILVRSHVAHHTVPGYVACNEGENILTWERFLRPQISFGVPMERMLGGEDSTNMEAAASMSVLRSLWQAHWLHEHQLKPNHDVFDWLEESLTALGDEFDDFIDQMEGAGWDQSQIFLKVPKEPVLVLEHLDQEA
ncbi:protein root UVB sensitive 5-like isoform X2 [Lolium rigidum]|uniref:protein root UVB sensitive 5-like isoform X2 n=1 Tax=Lolium rigidum TaxID=89674 RepID=UPI001F5D27DF|nr:protein root UVB sensitive 5-like isoform X2 [Lolium rigidum]